MQIKILLLLSFLISNNVSGYITVQSNEYQNNGTCNNQTDSIYSEYISDNQLINSSFLGNVENDSLSNYYVTKCSSAIEAEYPSHHYGIRKCPDGTTSFDQPDSEGMFNQEGKCGQTAASNVYNMYCKMIASPDYCDGHLDDATPGVSPSTMDEGIDKLFNENSERCPRGYWDETKYNYESDFILGIEHKVNSIPSDGKMVERTLPNGSTRKKAPVVVLIKSPGSKKGLHWITVVDIERKNNNCHMIVNTWGGQYKVPCQKIARWSRQVEESFGLFLSKYTVIDFHSY